MINVCCLRRERVVIPPALSERARIHFHSNHQGSNTLKSTARHWRLHWSAGLRLSQWSNLPNCGILARPTRWQTTILFALDRHHNCSTTQNCQTAQTRKARRQPYSPPWNPHTPSPTSQHQHRITEDIFMNQQNQASHRQNDQQSISKASSTNHSSINLTPCWRRTHASHKVGRC